MSKIIEAQEIDERKWADLANEATAATWFQTREAFGFYGSIPSFEAFAFAVETDGQLKGVVVCCLQRDGGRLKQFFSRRAIITGGPLLADDITEEELILLLTALKTRLKRKAIYIETRNFNDYGHWQQTFESCGFAYVPHYDIWVDTTTMEVVNEHLGKSRKRDVRVSLRDGASLVAHPTLAQVMEYYAILLDLYTTKVKTPLPSIEFFERLFEMPSSVFLLVEYEGRIVGGTVCVGLDGRALYEMYACGRDGVYKNIFPSELATFAGLQYAAENGFARFDMMGAGKPDDGGYGVRDFKLKFGGELVELGRNQYVCNRLLYAIGKLGVKIMKKS